MATALLIVDVQRGMFADPNVMPHDGTGSVARIRGLLDRARGASVPVFFVQHDGGKGDPLEAGTDGFPFVSALRPEAGEDVTVKREADAFEGTDLAAKLRLGHIDHLMVCGMQTEFCIDATVRGAVANGFDVTLVSDAHTTFDARDASAERIIAEHNDGLGKIASLVSAADVAF